ncbi:unnamed protein product [Prorocentrum cordatum]|uniref:Uncharacterized protein n=1 Tax=Prorocentrum cordatum TaxID=2364126 RepID=A0ABN9TND1_9DINO|nr:unnamed protein product [Polarella glacialis]
MVLPPPITGGRVARAVAPCIRRAPPGLPVFSLLRFCFVSPEPTRQEFEAQSKICAVTCTRISQEQIAMAQSPPPRSRRPKRLSIVVDPTPAELGHKRCARCGFDKAPNQYHKDRNRKDGHASYCKKCISEAGRQWRNTLRGTVCGLVSNARHSSRARGLSFNMSFEDVLRMLSKQSGLCFYSGIPMECCVPNSHWRMSLERVDNSEGYTVSNCVLIAAEFNSGDASRNKRGVHKVCGTAQWSRQKVSDVFTLRNLSVDCARLERLIGEARSPHCGRQHVGREAWGAEVCASHFYCDQCTEQQGNRPCIDISLHCVGCKRATTFKYNRTLRGNMMRLMVRARSRALKRGHGLDLNLDILLDKLLQQQGRCYYSGVPLQYLTPNSDWRVSLERLDNALGYTATNSVLVAHEFNTSDWSRGKLTHAVRGTAQWSREKVDLVWGGTRTCIAQATSCTALREEGRTKIAKGRPIWLQD